MTPVAAVLAVVVRGDEVLLVRRANPPDAGKWGFPGGRIEPGERLETAALRELAEETGVTAEFVRVFDATDVLSTDGGIRRHFVLVACLCRWRAGEPAAADDALEARWFTVDRLEEGCGALSAQVAQFAREARALVGGASG